MSGAEPGEAGAEGEAPFIVDAHCHIASEEIIPRSFIDGAVSNMEAVLAARGVRPAPGRLADMYRQKLQDPLCDELVAEMDAAGIARAVLLAADFSYALRDCRLTVAEAFDRHRAVLARHPGRFEVFGGVDPRWGADGVALFERSLAEFGFRGLKVYPPCGFSPSDPALFPYYELCAHHGVPVLLHVGPTSPTLSFETSAPFLLDAAARAFPTVPFIMAHGTVNFADEAAMLCRFRPNVFLDVSGFQSQLANDPRADNVRAALSRGINHKVIFATDWPVFRLQGDQRSFVELLTGPDGAMSELSDADRELVLCGNAERVLGAAGRAAAG